MEASVAIAAPPSDARSGAWPAFVVLAVQAAARAFIMPAQQAISMNIVPVSVQFVVALVALF